MISSENRANEFLRKFNLDEFLLLKVCMTIYDLDNFD